MQSYTEADWLAHQIPITGRFFALALQCLRSAVVISCWLVAISAPVVAAPVPLTLSDAIRFTLEEHPELRAFSHRQAAFDAEVQQAGVAQRARVGLLVEDAVGTGEYDSFNRSQSTLSIDWILEQDAIDSRVKAAQAAATQVDFKQEIKALDLAAHTAKLFLEALVQQKRLELAKLAENQSQQALSAIAKRVEAGKGSETERLQTEAELARRELQVEDLQHELKSGRYQLVASWAGNEQDYLPVGDLYRIPVVDSFKQELRKLQQHPAVQAFANQQRIAESKMELARIEAKPKWELSAGVRRYEATDDYGLVAGVSIPWGTDNRSTGKVRALRARQAEYQAEAQALSRKLNTQLYVLLTEINHSRHVIETLTGRVIPLLEKALSQSSQAYEIGQLGYVQWTAVRQDLLASRAELLDAYLAIHLQHIEIQRLTGASLVQ